MRKDFIAIDTSSFTKLNEFRALAWQFESSLSSLTELLTKTTKIQVGGKEFISFAANIFPKSWFYAKISEWESYVRLENWIFIGNEYSYYMLTLNSFKIILQIACADSDAQALVLFKMLYLSENIKFFTNLIAFITNLILHT